MTKISARHLIITVLLFTVLNIVSGSSVVRDFSQAVTAERTPETYTIDRLGSSPEIDDIDRIAERRRDAVIQLVISRPKLALMLDAANTLVFYIPLSLPLPTYVKLGIGYLLLRMDVLFHLAKLLPVVGIYWQLSSLQSPITRYTYKKKCEITILLDFLSTQLFRASRAVQIATLVLAVTILVLVPCPDVLSYLNRYHTASIEYSNQVLDTLLSECDDIDSQPRWKRHFLIEFKKYYEALVVSVHKSRKVLEQVVFNPCSAPFLRLTNLDDCCELNCFPILLCHLPRRL